MLDRASEYKYKFGGIMKLKRLLIIVLALTAMIAAATSAGCNNGQTSDSTSDSASVELTGIAYKSGLADFYYENTKINLSKLTVTAEYADKSKKDVVYNDKDFTVTGADTVGVGTKTITIGYGGKVTTKTVEIKENKYTVTTFEKPAFIIEYENNIKEQDNKQTEFADRTQGYFVGDDNAFAFLPKFQAIDSGMNLVNMNDKEKDVSLFKFNGTAFVQLEGEEIASNAAIDAIKCTFDFTDGAVGNKYKIVVSPKNLSEKQTLSDYTCTLEVSVIDGYNCTSAAELSLFDNRYATNASDVYGLAWKAWREEHNITVDPQSVKSIVFHGDIAITVADFPKIFLYNEGDSDVLHSHNDYGSYEKDKKVVGSLRDWSEIFVRNLSGDEQFSLIGNYFKLDGSRIPFIIRALDDDGIPKPAGNVVVSHAELLRYTNPSPAEGDTARGVVKNLNAVGNVNRTESKYTGGLILIKCPKLVSDLYNVITRSWYITAFAEENGEAKPCTIDKCKFYDNYSNFLYSWGGYMKIKNSEMIGAGGPVIIADHVSPKDSGGGTPSETIIENSKLESWVTGSEGWFNNMGATQAAAQMIGFDGLFFRNFGRTYVKIENPGTNEELKFINIILLIKSGDAEAMTFDKISGKASLDGEHSLNFDEQFTAGMLYNSAILGTGAPAFQGSEPSGISIFNGTNMLGYTADFTGVEPIVSPTHKLFTGDYLNVFVSGDKGSGYMGIVLGGYSALT